MPVRLDVFEVRGLAPNGHGEMYFKVDANYREWLRDNGPEWKYYDGGLVPELLRSRRRFFGA
jgi:hypothetical protein